MGPAKETAAGPAEAGADRVQLPKPGQIVHRDFREVAHRGSSLATSQTPWDPQPAAEHRPLRLLSWNIERGYKLDQIVSVLHGMDADVLSIQEVDWGCDRSGGKDTGAAIAAALKLNYLFLCEFEELRSPLRDRHTQGGGVHGNAIYSKHEFAAWGAVEHSHHPVDWEAPHHPLAAREPRHGRRLTLAADIATPKGALRVYCCHLEVFCGILGRAWQFSDVIAHAALGDELLGTPAAPQKGDAPAERLNMPSRPACGAVLVQPAHTKVPVAQAILGDLNTMAHGVARLSPNYCCDELRWRTLGWSEAEFWDRYVLSVHADVSDPDRVNTHMLSHGLPRAVAAALVNPGFKDPFDVRADITLDNPKYTFGLLHLMAGKLDWVLLRGMHVLRKAIGNHNFTASDHKWLAVDVLLT